MLACARAVQAVHAGKSLSDALTATPTHLRAAVQAITFHVMRRLGLATEIKNVLVRRTPPNALFDALLQVSIALLDTALEAARPNDAAAERGAHVPVYTVHTVVDQAVRAASNTPGMQPYKGLLNAALRRYTRERDDILTQVLRKPVARWNYPLWWVKQLQQAYPAQWESLLTAGDQPGPMTLRVNLRRTSVDALLQRFAQEGIQAERLGGAGLVLAQARPVHDIVGFDQGWWSVQDAAAQQAAALLEPFDGARVLDACSAPGGKTAHLLEMAQVELLALDSDAGRLERVGHNLDRLGLRQSNVQLVCADAAELQAWWDGRPFDLVLADVPCTASGVVRRHPDIRWLRREADIDGTAALQQQIIAALWRTVKPGGRLLYATCSIFPQEGERQAQRFLSSHADAQRLPAPGQILPLPDEGGRALYDGFFYALFAKHA
ncbi:MAG TPA: 16S rRNA (cytosine(967)-C(5))-methyltransferase RsmB [Pusillimonas sp.]|uniref:16S rRNA (cytosine(967)-C(5))-methyltransferase RsmB n=1 Tax=Pusillimonas sp. TaxID=3040095 RepID=UPI002CFC4841|nr:16S rRNA (cytosine(967)-C(5))-methyltransferase RsmB [Pusillimonas sp.]HUH87296.1 16S rRNA (cytosine(967)-C(5))-methyltransferase RsmB [Pusillimonas sp.]